MSTVKLAALLITGQALIGVVGFLALIPHEVRQVAYRGTLCWKCELVRAQEHNGLCEGCEDQIADWRDDAARELEFPEYD